MVLITDDRWSYKSGRNSWRCYKKSCESVGNSILSCSSNILLPKSISGFLTKSSIGFVTYLDNFCHIISKLKIYWWPSFECIGCNNVFVICGRQRKKWKYGSGLDFYFIGGRPYVFSTFNQINCFSQYYNFFAYALTNPRNYTIWIKLRVWYHLSTPEPEHLPSSYFCDKKNCW